MYTMQARINDLRDVIQSIQDKLDAIELKLSRTDVPRGTIDRLHVERRKLRNQYDTLDIILDEAIAMDADNNRCDPTDPLSQCGE